MSDRPKFFDDLAGVAGGAISALAGLRQEAEAIVRARIDETIRALDLVRLFDVVWALTKGGPGTMTETLSIFTYVKGFQQFETSYTAAMALLVIVLLSVAVFAALKRVELAR